MSFIHQKVVDRLIDFHDASLLTTELDPHKIEDQVASAPVKLSLNVRVKTALGLLGAVALQIGELAIRVIALLPISVLIAIPEAIVRACSGTLNKMYVIRNISGIKHSFVATLFNTPALFLHAFKHGKLYRKDRFSIDRLRTEESNNLTNMANAVIDKTTRPEKGSFISEPPEEGTNCNVFWDPHLHWGKTKPAGEPFIFSTHPHRFLDELALRIDDMMSSKGRLTLPRLFSFATKDEIRSMADKYCKNINLASKLISKIRNNEDHNLTQLDIIARSLGYNVSLTDVEESGDLYKLHRNIMRSHACKVLIGHLEDGYTLTASQGNVEVRDQKNNDALITTHTEIGYSGLIKEAKYQYNITEIAAHLLRGKEASVEDVENPNGSKSGYVVISKPEGGEEIARYHFSAPEKALEEAKYWHKHHLRK